MNKWLQTHPRLRNKVAWTTAIGALAMVASQVASLLGYQIEGIVGQSKDYLMAIITILAATGVFLDPPQLPAKEQNNQLPAKIDK